MMKRWLLIVIVLLVIISLAALGLYAWYASPLAGNFLPPDGAEDVPVRSAIQITFSEPMQHDSVESRLSTDPERSGSFTWSENTLTFTPDLPWPSGSQVRVRLEAGGRADGGLGLPVWTNHTWTFTTAQALLVYLWPSDGPADLHMLDPLSGEVRQLTDQANVLEYSISQDGLVLYFSATNEQAGSDLYRLDVLQAILQGETLVSPSMLLACDQAACRSPQASPDGHWLAYERIEPGGESIAQVWLLDLPSSEPAPLGAEGHVTESPHWSVENILVYFDAQEAGYIFVDMTDGRRFMAPNSTGQLGAWAPDGSVFLAPEIIYVEGGEGPVVGSSHLIEYVPFGSIKDLTPADILEDTAPAYAPDGGTIAYARKFIDEKRWSFGRQLWLMNSDGRDQRQITEDGLYNHYEFAWSWDGRWLAYVRFENASYSEPTELWLRDADGSDPIQLNFGGYSPQWIP
jgi:dipeptidyl aminopeptidase/acylaminoacyl peptidase